MNDKYRITGLMSGSSMDGTDLACCDLTWDGTRWDYRIIEAETKPYDPELKSKLEMACHWSRNEIEDLDRELGVYYASLLNDFHARHHLLPDLISSHGHTILHEPKRGVTFQAGKGSIMAKRTGIKVINDFRSEDVAQGGQGAPLVPLGDRLLFARHEGCINLGGFANISYQNPDGQIMAYDLSPANMALNQVAGLKGLEFDKDGELARQGTLHSDLFQKMNQLDYYQAPAPKSLGREWFISELLPLMDASGLSPEDLMATVLEHIAYQVAQGINEAEIKSVLITGGGALNQTLISRLSYYAKASIEIPGEQLIHYKEALVFALLGALKIRGEINCLSSVTGGKKDLSAGTIHNN
jgi:anhydro-N-acetylmuramic acid kinase